MIKSENNFLQVKESIKQLKGKSVLITENLGRNKFVSFKGVVTGVYPALFTIKPDIKRLEGKTSFSYADLMCGTISLKAL